MVTIQRAREFAKSLPDVTSQDHFGSEAFRANKRIFATLWHQEKKMNLRLSPKAQREFLELDEEAFVEIDNAWGKQGWTSIRLEAIEKPVFEKALLSAWEFSAKKNQTSHR